MSDHSSVHVIEGNLDVPSFWEFELYGRAWIKGIGIVLLQSKPADDGLQPMKILNVRRSAFKSDGTHIRNCVRDDCSIGKLHNQ
jgi:hypothetical protein